MSNAQAFKLSKDTAREFIEKVRSNHLRVYYSEATDSLMIYDAEWQVACYGEAFYYQHESVVRRFWTLIGDY